MNDSDIKYWVYEFRMDENTRLKLKSIRKDFKYAKTYRLINEEV